GIGVGLWRDRRVGISTESFYHRFAAKSWNSFPISFCPPMDRKCVVSEWSGVDCDLCAGNRSPIAVWTFGFFEQRFNGSWSFALLERRNPDAVCLGECRRVLERHSSGPGIAETGRRDLKLIPAFDFAFVAQDVELNG